ncbi:hypothetical protein [Solidesulfovibrio carbinolicus]|uniref:Uncharacterized protein n=1 Tax=Solidesulfovibrio carbinolicus TaxID=296842 RepID=A0A4P6HP94_9BACT|nr:hypothetical protein [Solidesulfovibrio carbinolicus]QAZ69107.1 hypothetical protein C3Y92_18435 [Solidesulfovibrio carbinolicus]
MLSWLQTKWRALSEWRRKVRELHPDAFRAMAGELAELAEVASKVRPEEQAFLLKIRRIRQEMRELERLAERPEFRLLSAKKRHELRVNLLSSREQLLKTLSDAPVVTTTPQ